MVLPLYLAMTAREMEAAGTLPRHFGWMACHFSPDGAGLCDLPEALPPGAMLILDDRFPCRDHDPRRIAAELADAAARLKCESVLLDFEREPEENSKKVADALFKALPCPVAAPPGFAEDAGIAVFLPPCPLHVPLEEYLRPWQGQDIWLEAALRQQTITVTRNGTQYGAAAPSDRLTGGVIDEVLSCRSLTKISENEVKFTLFDTPQTLEKKLDCAAALGVGRAVSLYQEIGK